MSPAASKRRLILEAIVSRLEDIALNNGYETDAGLALYTGEIPQLGEDDPTEAIAVVFGEDDPKSLGDGRGFVIRLQAQISALCKVSADEPWQRIEMVLADIKRAMETNDLTLGGLLTGPFERSAATQTHPREPGSLTAGIMLPYTLTYKEGWGAP